MQISEAWLRRYVNPSLSMQELADQLTMAGLEVDSVETVGVAFSGVVVAEVLSVVQHPDADRLKVCQVDAGTGENLQIVCGASNVRPGLKVPAALIGAILPGDFKIKQSKLRGLDSFGMLCSEKEIGIAEEAIGLMELPVDAPVGTNIRDYLNLDDHIVEIDLTPNRADCLSVEGIAREVALLNKLDCQPVHFEPTKVTIGDILPMTVLAVDACPRYLGRLIKGVNPAAETPVWMQERLRRSGLRSLGSVVDVTNYVLLEMGQPMHAFDADKLSGGITVRMAREAETLALLNGQHITLTKNTLVIADANNPLAFAGVMGGSETAVSEQTSNIFLECAFFAPTAIAGRARQYGLHTDSSHRFERGVDPDMQQRAMERATQLIVEVTGGQPGPVNEFRHDTALPKRNPILVRLERVEAILGLSFSKTQVEDILLRLGMSIQPHELGWLVTPPGFRFDIVIEADVVEEIARVYGYNNLPNLPLLTTVEPAQLTETATPLNRIKQSLVNRGYQEAITYSFVDEAIQQLLAPSEKAIRIQNPISMDLSIMRSSLWCGLLKAASANLNRQHTRIRFFESGLRFLITDDGIKQEKMLAGLALGSQLPEQWGEKKRNIDFYDVKGDVDALFALAGREVSYRPSRHPSLHPGQTAEVLSETGEVIGFIGMLHPSIEQELGFETKIYLFELAQDLLLSKPVANFKPLSKYPSVRRDMAIIVAEAISIDDIIRCIKKLTNQMLQDIVVFDVYQGKGIEENHKSVALGLILQNFNQTLTDSEIDATFNQVLQTLTNTFGAQLRN
jgi:phenylalanyl-tRNA synthetase beta chain